MTAKLEGLWDRNVWSSEALRDLLSRIDAELQRRSGSQAADDAAATTPPPRARPIGDDELKALEERLRREARAYATVDHAIRG